MNEPPPLHWARCGVPEVEMVKRERRLVVRVAVTFALTILSFLVSRFVTELERRQIEREATAISANALTATEALTDLRTQLRRMAFQMEALSVSTAPELERHLTAELDAARAEAAAGWARYVAVPFLPGEAPLVAMAEADIEAARSIVVDVTALVSHGDREGAAQALNELALPMIARADDDCRALVELNRIYAQQAAIRIGKLARAWGLLPDLVSAVFAVAAAYFGIRMVRRYLTLSEERSTELEQFAGRVSHDLRSPLSAVSIALEVAAQGKEIDARTRTLLERAHRTLQRAGQLVDGLLVFATSTKDGAGDRTAAVRDVLDGLVEDVTLDAERNDIEIDYERPATDLVVACSPGVLMSITGNIVSNAIKFMGDSPVRRISIRVRDLGRAVRVEITDTGPGVPPELHDKVFLPLVRGADAKVPGMGLGLATVRRLAEAHGGEVGLESPGEGGSRFWIRLRKAGVVLPQARIRGLRPASAT